MLSFALVNWGSSSSWIGTYFLGHIEKTMIHPKLLRSLKSFGRFQCFEVGQHKCSFELPFVQEWGVSAPSLNTLFIMLKLLCKICQTVSLSMLINSATARMLRRRFCRTISPTLSMFASDFFVLRRPGRWSSPISSHPYLKLLNHLKTWVQDRHSSP